MTDAELVFTVLYAHRDNALGEARAAHERGDHATAERERIIAEALGLAIEAAIDRLDLDGTDDEHDDRLTDREADALTLASVGWGTDEDYGYYGSPWDD